MTPQDYRERAHALMTEFVLGRTDASATRDAIAAALAAAVAGGPDAARE